MSRGSLQRERKRRWLYALVYTPGARWVVPSRVLIGLVMLLPFQGGLPGAFGLHDADTGLITGIGVVLRALEILIGLSFVAGFAVRASCYAAIVVCAVHGVANVANSFKWLAIRVDGILMPVGDWAYGMLYFGAIMLILDIARVGSGCWSLDHWLTARLGMNGTTHKS